MRGEPGTENSWPGQEISRPDPAAETEHGIWAEARAEMAADIDPEALTVMAEADADMAGIRANREAAAAAAEQHAEQRARAWAEVEQAGIDEPAGHAQAQLEGAAAHPEAGDMDLEI